MISSPEPVAVAPSPSQTNLASAVPVAGGSSTVNVLSAMQGYVKNMALEHAYRKPTVAPTPVAAHTAPSATRSVEVAIGNLKTRSADLTESTDY